MGRDELIRRSPLLRAPTPRRRGVGGRVEWVQLDIDDAAENSDHLITAEQRWRVAMARQ